MPKDFNVNMEKINKKLEVYQRLARVETKLDELQKAFDKFIDNDFKHLRDRVDWIFWIFLLGTLVSIALSLFKR